jgi:hypothetical protein
LHSEQDDWTETKNKLYEIIEAIISFLSYPFLP